MWHKFVYGYHWLKSETSLVQFLRNLPFILQYINRETVWNVFYVFWDIKYYLYSSLEI